VPVGDVATCFVQALTEPRSVGMTYDLGGGEVLTLAEIIDVILRVTGRRRWKLPLPWGIAQLQATCMEFVFPRLLRQAAPLNRDQLLMLREDNTGNAQSARELFGLRQESFESELRTYLPKQA
jgi:NADH dehydrogenase